MQAQGSKDGKPKQKVIISDCGEYVWMKKECLLVLYESMEAEDVGDHKCVHGLLYFEPTPPAM